MLDPKGESFTTITSVLTSCVSLESRRNCRGCEGMLLPDMLLPKICELLSLLSTVMCVQSSVPQTCVCVWVCA
jgi:hypothetical protein